MFIVFYTVKIVCICVSMTCSYPTVFVTHGSIECMYTYVCVYTHTHTHTYIILVM